jgi:type II secretory pathway pseudopilin PulG
MRKLLSKDNLTTAGYLIGGGVLAYVVIKNFNKIAQKIKLQQQLNLYAQAQQGYNVTTPTGQTVTVTVNLAQVSQEINDAFYNNDWFGSTEDEAAAIAAVKRVPKQLIPQLTQTYAQLFSKDLRSEFVKYLSTDEFQQVAYLFN